MTLTKQKKSIIISAIAVIFVLISALTVIHLTSIFANDNDKNATFTVEAAQVKQYSTSNDSGSLRFVVNIPNEVYDQHSPDNGYSYGTILLPEHMLGEDELTVDNEQALNIPTNSWQAWKEGDASHIYTAVLKGQSSDVIDASFFNTPITARGYIKNSSGEIVAYTEPFTRSIGYVAVMNVAIGSENTVIKAIAENTDKSVSIDKTTLVNTADKIIPGVVFGGVKVPESQLHNLNISYETTGTGVTASNGVIIPSGTGTATVTLTLTLPGYSAITSPATTILSHELVSHDAVAASCDAAGSVEYWSCSGCGKNYSDANAVNELASTVIDPLGHNYEEAYRMDATYTEKGYIFEACSRCKDERSNSVDMLGHKTVEGTATLAGGSSFKIVALTELGGATEYANPAGYAASGASWADGADYIFSNVQKGTINGTSTATNFFRITLNIDFTQNTSTSFEFGMNYATVNFIIGGKTVKIPSMNAWNKFTVMGDGSVYLNGEQIPGAKMTGNSIVFEIDKGANAPYAQFVIKKAVSYIRDTREYELTAGDIAGTPISALGGTALTPWASAPAVAEKTVSGVKQNVISQQIQNYKDGNNKMEWNYFRYTIELNFKQFESVTIPVATNVITGGAFDVYVDGVKGVITTGNTWNYIKIMQDGTVYFNGVLMQGALIEDYVVIELDTHRPTGTYYGEFYIGTPTLTLAEDAPIYNWEDLDIDLGVNANGTKTEGNVGYAEDQLGITSVTEFTFAAWQHSALPTLDLTKYEMVKFYLYRPSSNGGGAVYDQGNGGSNGGIIYLGDPEYVDTWVEIILKKSVYGDYYNLYVNGERQRIVFKDGDAFTNLNQLALNGASGKLKYSNVTVVNFLEPTWESVGMDKYNIASGMSGTKTDVTLTDAETALGITSVKAYQFTGTFQNAAFAALDLTQYECVKFYVKRTATGGDVRTSTNGDLSGRFVDMSDLAWHEFVLVKNAEETGFDVYVDGVLSGVKFGLNGDGVGTQVPLTNMNQFALNGSSGTVQYSNLQVVKTDEKWDALDYNFASSMTNGTKADGTVTDIETEFGITSVKQFTITSWGNQSFAALDILAYDEVKFYIQGTAGSIRTNSDGNTTGVIATLNSSWQEIRLVKNAAGTGFDVYVDGTKSSVKFYTDNSKTTEVPLTNMKQLALNGSSGTVKCSNLMTPHVPAFEYVGNENYNLASGMTNGTKADGTVTDIETALGITSVKQFTITSWGNQSFADLDILAYDEVKFYIQGTAGSIRTNSDGSTTGVIATLNNSWQEIRLVKNAAGTGFDVYVDGTKSSVKFYTDNKKTTEVPLTNMNQFALNGSNGTVQYSNIMVGYDDYYAEPGIEYPEEEISSDYTIIFDNTNTQVNYAAVELQSYFKEATGTLLFKNPYRGVNSIKGNVIVLGVLPASDKGYSFEGLGESDYVIKKDGNVIYIYGKTGYGVVNGVYGLLEQLFDLEIYYKDTYTITKRDGFVLTANDVTENTVNFTFDYIWSGLGELKPTEENGFSEDYAYQMGFVTNYYASYQNVHNATTMLEEYRSTHPEWFYSEKGKNYGQIYLSAENFATGEGTLVTTVAEKIFAMLKEDEREREIALLFSAMDEDIWPHGTGYANSDALYSKYGTYAAENILFMNAVAKELDTMMTSDPLGRTIQLELLCYNKTLVAPDLNKSGLTQADKNAVMMYSGTNISVVPMIAPVEGNRYLSFEDSRNKVKNPATGEVDNGSKTIAEVIEGWQALANGNDMHMWWYASDGFDFFVMMDTITNMQANYQFAASHGITVMYNQSQGNNAVAPDWSRLKIYVQSELQKDVNADVDALIDEWMDAYFGAGAESMKTLLAAQKTWYGNFFSAVFKENAGHYTAGGFAYSDDMEKWHFTESPKKPTFWDSTKNTMLVTWMGYIDSAKAAIDADTTLSEAEKAELKARVDLESLTIRYTLIEKFGTKTYDQSTSAFYQFAKQLGVTRSDESTLIP